MHAVQSVNNFCVTVEIQVIEILISTVGYLNPYTNPHE